MPFASAPPSLPSPRGCCRPGTFDPEVTDILTFWREQGLPVALSAAPMAGSTSPLTLAGTLTQLNAEELTGMVYTQLVRPGTPGLAGYIPGQMNPRSGAYLAGTAEFGMMQAAAAPLAQFYNVPIYCTAGMIDSETPGQQAGYDVGGASYIQHAVGMIENMNAVSYEQMVVDNDLILMVKRVLRGINTDPDHLAVEAIQRVGPGSHYLTDEHTLRHLRSEFVFPALAERNHREVWLLRGAPDLRQRATDLVNRLLAEPRPRLLPASLDEAIRARFRVHDELG